MIAMVMNLLVFLLLKHVHNYVTILINVWHLNIMIQKIDAQPKSMVNLNMLEVKLLLGQLVIKVKLL